MNDISLARNHHRRIRLGISWLAVIPIAAWAVSNIYIPLFSENMPAWENAAVTATILLLMILSVLVHLLAHLFASRLAGAEVPESLPILPFGDAAQSWSADASGWREAGAAAAGPFLNLALSGLAYLLWNAQIGIFLNLVTLFVCVFNLWLCALNLLPTFPTDGGRILRAGLRGLVLPKLSLNDWIRRLGFIVCAVLVVWGTFLYLQNSRFSPETAGITFGLVLLLLDGLRFKPATEPEVMQAAAAPRPHTPHVAMMALLAAAMLLAFASTLMTNEGLDAHGLALSVEPMVNVPPPYRHVHKGTLMLTTVFSHAPILVGEWLVAHVDRAMAIQPPEVVVPKDTTLQQQAQQGYQMLDESEATALAVGLRLAGYKADLIGKGVEVLEISPESRARGILQVGDIITALNGQPVRTTDDLIRLVKAQPATMPVRLDVQRQQTKMVLTVPLLPPDASSSTPRIGISIQSAGFDFRPPFPVSINTQKINGGPSAGLMFTLTVYNTLSAQDLTGGRKIAGTGTISLDGSVGPSGGVKQKVAAAEAAGAVYFLCPVENYPDAVSMATSIRVVEVANVQDALNFLRGLPPR